MQGFKQSCCNDEELLLILLKLAFWLGGHVVLGVVHRRYVGGVLVPHVPYPMLSDCSHTLWSFWMQTPHVCMYLLNLQTLELITCHQSI